MSEVAKKPTGSRPAERAAVPPSTVRRAVVASAMGNAMEWFDYGVFTSGTITGVIGRVFFPGDSNAVLKSLALVAVGFIVRPFGGAFFGPLGDKIGRKKVLAITILTMSMCTFLVGVLPTYAAIGLAAPIILLTLRLIQGFSTGGEYGGAATFIAEYAPTKRRGFYGAFLEVGTLTGYVLGNSLVLIVSLSVGGSAMDSWGWRVPFLLALPMGLIGLYLRERLDDPPAFRAMVEKEGEPDKIPLLETLHGYWPMILNLVGIVILLNVADYMLLTTMPSYFTEHLKISDNTSTVIIIAVELGQMALLVPLGALSDRIGRKPLLKAAALGYLVLSYPAIRLMQAGHLYTLVIGFAVVACLLALILAVIGSTFPAMFPTHVRYGAFAIGYNVSTSVFGGTAGVVTEFLINHTGDKNWPAYYLMIAAAIAVIPIWLLPETAKVPIAKIDAEDEAALQAA